MPKALNLAFFRWCWHPEFLKKCQTAFWHFYIPLFTFLKKVHVLPQFPHPKSWFLCNFSRTKHLVFFDQYTEFQIWLINLQKIWQPWYQVVSTVNHPDKRLLYGLLLVEWYAICDLGQSKLHCIWKELFKHEKHFNVLCICTKCHSSSHYY